MAAVVGCIVVGGCSKKTTGSMGGGTSGQKFIDPANMNPAVSPGQDFYEYANGTWLKNTVIPPAESRWGSFNLVSDFNQKALKNILETAAASGAAKGTPQQEIGDFFAAGMDSVAIEQAGAAPIRPWLERIDAIQNIRGLQDEIAALRIDGIGSVFGFGTGQDAKNTNSWVPFFSQGGIHLPDRDYYFKEDDNSKKIRAAYEVYITNLFKLTGESEARAKETALEVVRFEKALANASMTRVERRDPNKTYHKMTVAELNALAPLFHWQEMLTKLSVQSDTVIVSQPGFMKEIEALLKKEKLDQWKNYLRWCVLDHAAPFLSSAFVAESFKFNQTLSGQKEMQPRWKRVMGATDRLMADPLGSIYVATYFTPAAKARMLELVGNLSKTFEKRIQGLDWMSDATKQQALYKLSRFTPKIGYPDKWKDYSGVPIDRKSYFNDVIANSRYLYFDNVNKVGKPVDRTTWNMSAPTVNASYSAQRNDITFPAGILRFPFFDPNADDAVNYAGIGAVIGHEMTHGFDDQGRKFDADGNLRDWWTADDAKKFDQKAARVGEQYSAYTVLDTMHVNGKLTMGENLADLGGLSLAYEAFKTYTPQGKTDTKIDGFTPDQRFFLSWAQIWRENTRPEQRAQLINTDPHSPGRFRCNGPLSNMPEFYRAFNVKEGDAMWKPESARAKVW